MLFFPSGKQKHCQDKVASMLQGGVKPHEETHMPMMAFPVPSLPPSMSSCKCMRMSYVLRVSHCFLLDVVCVAGKSIGSLRSYYGDAKDYVD